MSNSAVSGQPSQRRSRFRTSEGRASLAEPVCAPLPGPPVITDVRELKLDTDPIGQRAYDVVAGAVEGEIVSIDYSFPKPGTKQPATKQSLETRIGRQACGVSYFK